MWTILENRQVTKSLKKIPVRIVQAYGQWQAVIENHGPDGLRQITGFQDEALQGRWAGYRSSRLSHQYRVIYKVEADTVRVYVVTITAHDYRRK